MKKPLGKILLIFFIFSNLIFNTDNAVPPLEAKGVALIDGVTGKILYSKNADVQYEPASTTKVMTALLTVENCNLDDKVTIGEKPPLADGSSIGIQKGEVYTVRELLLGLMLESGNDTAEALAQHISGS
ncbi:MAG: D-alanyl-D-alanine carboxypeptidase family protein, partial [Clostridium sp.]